jgi:hypothetical protein
MALLLEVLKTHGNVHGNVKVLTPDFKPFSPSVIFLCENYCHPKSKWLSCLYCYYHEACLDNVDSPGLAQPRSWPARRRSSGPAVVHELWLCKAEENWGSAVPSGDKRSATLSFALSLFFDQWRPRQMWKLGYKSFVHGSCRLPSFAGMDSRDNDVVLWSNLIDDGEAV